MDSHTVQGPVYLFDFVCSKDHRIWHGPPPAFVAQLPAPQWALGCTAQLNSPVDIGNVKGFEGAPRSSHRRELWSQRVQHGVGAHAVEGIVEGQFHLNQCYVSTSRRSQCQWWLLWESLPLDRNQHSESDRTPAPQFYRDLLGSCQSYAGLRWVINNSFFVTSGVVTASQ